MANNKPILAVDVDDTIGHLMESLSSFYNSTYDEPHFSVDDYHTLEFQQIWKGTREECDEKVEQYYKSGYLEKICPIQHAHAVLTKLKEHFELHVVTARPHNVRDATIVWVNTNFDNIFTEFHFGNLYGLEGPRRKKSEICKTIGAVALIDDSAGYAHDCANSDIPVILFGNYAWNNSAADHELILRARDWHEVHDHVMNRFVNSK